MKEEREQKKAMLAPFMLLQIGGLHILGHTT
ncbi:MAG: hypothetical protein FD164_1897 [Nitrospirae bacterium]|nr:MAG: hypothetical protein FD164_1897 [Nitrospirota bacterium]